MAKNTVFLKRDELNEMKYFIASEDDNENEAYQMSFVAFRIKPSVINGFNQYTSAYGQDDNGDDDGSTMKRYISVEVRDGDLLQVSPPFFR